MADVRPTCNDCGARLIGPVADKQTRCPKCGRIWEVTPDGKHIHITLDVQSVTMQTSSTFRGSDNG